MSTRKIAATVIGVSFVGGSIAAWMFSKPNVDFSIFLTIIGIVGVTLVYSGVSKEEQDE